MNNKIKIPSINLSNEDLARIEKATKEFVTGKIEKNVNGTGNKEYEPSFDKLLINALGVRSYLERGGDPDKIVVELRRPRSLQSEKFVLDRKKTEQRGQVMFKSLDEKNFWIDFDLQHGVWKTTDQTLDALKEESSQEIENHRVIGWKEPVLNKYEETQSEDVITPEVEEKIDYILEALKERLDRLFDDMKNIESDGNICDWDIRINKTGKESELLIDFFMSDISSDYDKQLLKRKILDNNTSFKRTMRPKEMKNYKFMFNGVGIDDLVSSLKLIIMVNYKENMSFGLWHDGNYDLTATITLQELKK
ncbi:MAG: hypothetical protein ABIH87_00865 [bacterium]